LSRAGYQPLLEAGVRIFEWNGSMIHAKTAVADGRWARVGSTNLNLSSWIGNYELDVAIEDEPFAKAMEKMFLNDLENSTEIILSERHRMALASKGVKRTGRRRRLRGGSVSGISAGAIRISNTVGAAITNKRLLGPAEAKIMVLAGLPLLAFTGLILLWPKWVILPMALVSGWLALSFLVRAYKLHKKGDEGAGFIRLDKKNPPSFLKRKMRKRFSRKKQKNP
jgi:cardiolipin synthase